jgi:hypothetical protein
MCWSMPTDLDAQAAQALLDAKIADVDARIAGLQRLRGVLAERRARACPLMGKGG